MINEFRESISEKEIQKIAEKVMKLSETNIDNLFFFCNWIDENRGKNKALSENKISEIKKKKRAAIAAIKNLLLETPKAEVLKFLAKE